ncbi:hypothetical protein AK830_g3318 [Neonectria ditissima]|uniref:Uncharacterized protein n=1 Tax=Neonectria ditissima TaxID=78410 RepID=A0A0P7B929_9HYPO|nr:hypothetical protein AK830_g3318 [Neonectria ditissima]
MVSQSTTSDFIAINRLYMFYITEHDQTRKLTHLHDVSLPSEAITHHGGSGVCNFLVAMSRMEAKKEPERPEDPQTKDWAVKVMEHFKHDLLSLATALEKAMPSVDTKTGVRNGAIFIGCDRVSCHKASQKPKRLAPPWCYHSPQARESLRAYTGEGLAVFLTVVSMLATFEHGDLPRIDALETVWKKVDASLMGPDEHLTYLEDLGRLPSQMLTELNDFGWESQKSALGA